MTNAMTTTEQTTALAPREYAPDLAPSLVVSLDDLRFQLRQLEEFKRDIMVVDRDYGIIPGTPKPTLLKPGAEKLAMAFGLTPIFSVSNKVEDWERGFFHYEVTCELFSKRTGGRVANGIGSANSKEPRYRWRDAKPTCPNCGHDLRRSRNRDGERGEPGWYCWKKVGGCGAEYPAAQITAVGRVENPEPFELVNTLVKMAEKRALVASVLVATGGSGIWTQDVEDLAEEDIIDVPVGRATPIREREAEDMIVSADDRLWKRWLTIRSEALGLGVVIAEQRLPMAREALARYGTGIAAAINERKSQIPPSTSGPRTVHDQPDRAAEPSPSAVSAGRDEEASPVSPSRRPTDEELKQVVADYRKLLNDAKRKLGDSFNAADWTLRSDATVEEIETKGVALGELMHAPEPPF